MNSPRWSDFFKEPVSEKHRKNVFAAAQTELQKNKPVRIGIWQHARLIYLTGFFTIVVASFVIFKKRHIQKPTLAKNRIEFMSQDAEMLNNLEFFEDLETIEHWDVKND